MLPEQFCERLEQDLLPDASVVEVVTPWDKDDNHNRIPFVLVIVRGDRVFPRDRDMLSLIDPAMKLQHLTLKSFYSTLNIEWYIEEWSYNKKRVDLFTSIRDRAIESRDKSPNDRLKYCVEPPKKLKIELAKYLLKSNDTFHLLMLVGDSGVEIARLCEIECRSILNQTYIDNIARKNLKVFTELAHLINCVQRKDQLFK